MQVPGKSQNKSKQGKADLGAAGTAGRPLIDPCLLPREPAGRPIRPVRLAVDRGDEGSVWMPWPMVMAEQVSAGCEAPLLVEDDELDSHEESAHY